MSNATADKPGGQRRLGRPPGPAADHAQRRAELLDAATRVIRRLGPGASMDDIAAEAGLTKPMLYAHFGDKAGLTTALAERCSEDLLPRVLAALSRVGPPRENVRSAISTFISFVEAEPQLYRFLVRGVAGADPSFVDQQLILSFGLQLAQVLRLGLLRSGSDPAPADVWAFAVLGAVFGAAEWWIVRPTMSRDTLVDYMTALVWGGLSQAGLGEAAQE